MRSYRDAFVLSTQEAALISIVDIGVALATLFLFRVAFLDDYGFILLVESAGLLLLGGGLGFAGQPGVRRIVSLTSIANRREAERPSNDKGSEKQNDVRASVYMLTGLFLFLESGLLAVLVGSAH